MSNNDDARNFALKLAGILTAILIFAAFLNFIFTEYPIWQAILFLMAIPISLFFAAFCTFEGFRYRVIRFFRNKINI